MLNHIIAMGRLTRDPELRRTGSNIAVASFTIACDRDRAPEGQEKETDFLDCVAWRGTGEFVEKHFKRGSMAVVDGRLQVRAWTDKDGNKRRTAEIVASSVYFGDSKKEDSAPSGQYTGFVKNPAPSVPANDFQQLDDPDAQLPF
jgi:single-strand DNA-binding protein